tara:strand:- start:2670 stop:3068 length:399 start_codon:yes stop_codon:yes gene_type:complete
MEKCESKRGYFLLSDCPNPPTGNCLECNKPICAKHSLDQGKCPSCYFKGQMDAYESTKPKKEKEADQPRRKGRLAKSQKTYNHYDDVDLWYYSMRASRPAIYFENHDYSSFDFEDTYDSWQGDDFEDNFFDS